ncbi:MAG TPA: choice-of-anchor tandem repeat GloVer-containing protein [Terriglobia bacterium]|nr:choice-of-anchor tandem repeat GloVer-containing protein [Terriglobia bacterium]
MLVALWLSGSGSLLAQTFNTLHLFGSGGVPEGTLIEGTDGNLYGTTYGYAGKQNGMIFKVTTSGTFTTLHSGGAFAAGLTLGTDGNFYGTSFGGGTYGHGWVFKITPSGTLTTLYTFGQLPSGAYPLGLVQASDGNFYGTTKQGGTNTCIYGNTNYGCGTLFKITPGGTLTTLYNFCSQSGCADGQEPGALIQGTDGNLYGTTSAGANSACSGGCGTIFKITTSGTLTTLHSFDSVDGGDPSGLVQGSDGNFYGTAYSGGLANTNCYLGACGTVFSMTPAGTLTILHSFSYSDGGNPGAGLIQAADGNFYGTTAGGGTCTNFAYGCGTVFQITSTGALTTLHDFDKTDGAVPTGLLQHSNGSFYGPTIRGGANVYHACGGYCGTLFSLSVP